MLDVTPVKAFRDNYIWLIHAAESPTNVAIVDPGDAGPVLEALEANALTPHAILLTHHHFDHVGGVEDILARYPVPVFGPAGEATTRSDRWLAHGESARLPALGLAFGVIDVPGHTAGHIAYYGHGALFCGDTLFSAGCGRLFEGTAEQMLASLTRLAKLPAETRIYCGHEYTAANLRFALAVEPNNQDAQRYLARVQALRERGQPSLPSTIGQELTVNPFLRCHEPTVEAAAARRDPGATDPASVFAVIRHWKDTF